MNRTPKAWSLRSSPRWHGLARQSDEVVAVVRQDGLYDHTLAYWQQRHLVWRQLGTVFVSISISDDSRETSPTEQRLADDIEIIGSVDRKMIIDALDLCDKARRLFQTICSPPGFIDFLTLPGYELLVQVLQPN